jgi:hypothetical protein
MSDKKPQQPQPSVAPLRPYSSLLFFYSSAPATTTTTTTTTLLEKERKTKSAHAKCRGSWREGKTLGALGKNNNNAPVVLDLQRV